MTDTTTGMRDSILLHRVPGDPERTRLADAIKAGTYDSDHHNDSLGARIATAAAQLRMTTDTACKLLGFRIEFSDPERTPDGPGDIGFTMTTIPDGVRACWASECTHGPDYVPPAAAPSTEETA